jgi:hypothetical protein
MRKFIATITVLSALAGLGAITATAASKPFPINWKLDTILNVTVPRNSTLKWIWRDGFPHNVSGPGFKSKTIAKKGFSYTHLFNKKGSFTIICTVHPKKMRMVVRVG